jgi:glycosyltransferase involved in cell wall biosynthesis
VSNRNHRVRQEERSAQGHPGQRRSILFFTQFFPPETSAPANRVESLVSVIARSYDLMVVTLLPSYPSPQAFRGLNYGEIDEGRPFSIVRVGEFSPHAGSFVRRAFREMLMALRLGGMGLRYPAEAVIVSSPSMYLIPVAWFVARVRRAPLVIDIRDVTWRYAADTVSGLTARILARAQERVLIRFVKRATVVSVTNNATAEHLKSAGISQQKIRVVANGIARELLQQMPKDPASTKATVRIAYIGLIGRNQGLRVLVDIARRLPNYEFSIVGDGPALSKIKEEHAPRNLRIWGFLSRPEVVEIYKSTDILFAQLRDLPSLSETAVPSKLYEYMAAARPIVYAGSGAAADLVVRSGAGLVAPAEDVPAIAKAIISLADNPSMRVTMGRAGRRFVETRYVREELMEGFIGEFPSVLWSSEARPLTS